MVFFKSSCAILCSTHGSLQQLLAFKDLYIQTNLHSKFLKKFYKTMNFDLHPYHIISIQYPSHKFLPEKSCLHCLRIPIMSWLFKDPVVITKEIMSWLFKGPINSGLPQFDHAQSNIKKWPRGQKAQIPPNEFFSWNTTNKMLMYLLAPFN